MPAITGHCFCGAITYRSDGPELWSGHCHCDSCRRATSSPFTSFFGVPRADVTWSGDLVIHTTSDGRVSRGHCPTCGTQMTYQFTGLPDETHLYAATLDDPLQFTPQAHFHYAERLPWVQITDELPKYPGSTDTTEPL